MRSAHLRYLHPVTPTMEFRRAIPIPGLATTTKLLTLLVGGIFFVGRSRAGLISEYSRPSKSASVSLSSTTHSSSTYSITPALTSPAIVFNSLLILIAHRSMDRWIHRPESAHASRCQRTRISDRGKGHPNARRR